MPVDALHVRSGQKIKDDVGEATVVAQVLSSVGALVLVDRDGSLGAVPLDSLTDESSEAVALTPQGDEVSAAPPTTAGPLMTDNVVEQLADSLADRVAAKIEADNARKDEAQAVADEQAQPSPEPAPDTTPLGEPVSPGDPVGPVGPTPEAPAATPAEGQPPAETPTGE